MGNSSRRFRWRRLYYLLVAFALCTVCISLSVTHWLRGLYTQAVDVNRTWGGRLDGYSNLGDLLTALNAPGNDVFASADPDAERRRKEDAHQAMVDALARQRADLAGAGADAGDVAAITERLDAVERHSLQMSAEADRIFDDFAVDPTVAAKSMAAMDRSYAAALDELTTLREHVGGIQRRLFAEQAASAGRVVYLEYGIASLLVVMVSGATVYGHKMARRVEAAIDTERRAEVMAAERNALEAHREELERLATHDALSELPNRRLFMTRLGELLADPARRGRPLAVLFIDIDNFKVINDGIGHHAGDELIVAVARRLSGCVRRGDTLARLGGDEFTVLLADVDHESSPAQVARKIVAALAEPVSLAGGPVTITASVGVALGVAGRDDADAVVRRADLAMYDAKANGKGRFELYAPALSEAASERLRLAGAG
ncbi:MAG: diguanylate cyclase domain-containing protein [Acidimicrobiales bacterium]